MKRSVKKVTKAITVLCALFLLSIPATWAQRNGQRPQGPPPVPNAKQIELIIDELDQSIELSDAQETKIKTLFTEHFKEMGKNLKKSREEMEKKKEAFEKTIEAELSDEQQKGFEKFMENMEQKHRQH